MKRKKQGLYREAIINLFVMLGSYINMSMLNGDLLEQLPRNA